MTPSVSLQSALIDCATLPPTNGQPMALILFQTDQLSGRHNGAELSLHHLQIPCVCGRRPKAQKEAFRLTYAYVLHFRKKLGLLECNGKKN